MMTKLCSGQGKWDVADADTDDADAADRSNTYMSPFQATQKPDKRIKSKQRKLKCFNWKKHYDVKSLAL